MNIQRSCETEGKVLIMADTKEYLVQVEENGSIMISEEVIASIASIALREVEGVYGLSTGTNLDIGTILGKKNFRKGVRVLFAEEGMLISCNLVVKMGCAVLTVAKNAQEAIAEEVTTMTGIRPARVNINVCGIAAPKAPQPPQA